ncbi:MAG: hypothetical protein ABL930_11305, partial [Pseudobdellovibrio sp.]
FDIISSTLPITESTAKFLSENKWNIFGTFPISVGMIVFSKNAVKKTSPEERFYVSNLVKQVLSKSKIYKSNETLEFIQFFGEGYLDDHQKVEMIKLRESFKKLSTPLTLGVTNPDKWKGLAEQEKKISIVKLNKSGASYLENERPDIFMLTNDVSFDTSFSMFSFAVRTGLLRSDQLSSEDIIEKFIEYPDRSERIKFINKIHYESLKNCIIYPVWSMPYFTASKEGILAKQSKYNSRTLAWKLNFN